MIDELCGQKLLAHTNDCFPFADHQMEETEQFGRGIAARKSRLKIYAFERSGKETLVGEERAVAEWGDSGGYFLSCSCQDTLLILADRIRDGNKRFRTLLRERTD